MNIVGRLERAVIAPGLLTLLKLSIALEVPVTTLVEPFTPELVREMRTGARPASSRRPRSR